MNYKQEHIKPYDAQREKGEQVEEMFDNISHSYDLLNHFLSLGIDRKWRKAAINSLKVFHPRHILDVATGTGDFALLSASMLEPEKLLGVDISEGMMQVARKKAAEQHLDAVVSFQKEDCMQLSLNDNSFDAVTAAFGIRNFANLDQGLREMCRVLRPGGHLSIVELTTPPRFPMRQLFYVYSHVVLPIYGRLISKDKSAYSYLTRTIEAFPQGESMMTILRQAGFREPAFRRMTFGICTLYTAIK